MRFLLDICVLSDFARGLDATLERIRATAPREIAVSSVTEMEIVYGLRLNRRLLRRVEPVIEALLSRVQVLPYDRAAAHSTGELRAVLDKAGKPIGAYDALIAGTALSRNLILVTSNTREFRQVDALRLEDWRL